MYNLVNYWTILTLRMLFYPFLIRSVHCVTVESALCQKHAFIRKSTIFTRSLWNFDKRRPSCGPPFVKVSLWSGKKLWFFNKSMFLTKCRFYCHTVYNFEYSPIIDFRLNSNSAPFNVIKMLIHFTN